MPRYLRDTEVAELFSVGRQTIWRWVKTAADFPKPVCIGSGTTRWRYADLVAYDRRLADPTSGRSGDRS